MKMKLKDLIGEHELSGVSFGSLEITEGYNKGGVCNTVDFILDGETYSVIEDAEDGYRSSMKEILHDNARIVENKFPPLKVNIIEMPDGNYKKNDGLDFIDSLTGKIVMSIGTENVRAYYPAFISRFHPENMAHNAVT
jgi:hypothetical protein